MKYAILGDIHANLEALKAVLEEAHKLDCNRFICIGDIVGYNADPWECIEMVRKLELEAVVRGNHDEYVSSDLDLFGFNPQAALVVEWTREQINQEQKNWLGMLPYEQRLNTQVTLVHSTLDMPSRWGYVFDKLSAAASFNYQRTPICFFGHTHVPLAFDKFGTVIAGQYDEIILEPGHKYMINIGSVGQPRDGDPRAAFATYAPEEQKVCLHRVEYDLETCQRKIRTSELPERCAERLAVGR